MSHHDARDSYNNLYNMCIVLQIYIIVINDPISGEDRQANRHEFMKSRSTSHDNLIKVMNKKKKLKVQSLELLC